MWTVKWKDAARKELRKLSHPVQERILEYFASRVATTDDPRLFGKPLTGDKSGLWRYRVGDYRILCNIQDDIITVTVIHVAHRREVYD